MVPIPDTVNHQKYPANSRQAYPIGLRVQVGGGLPQIYQTSIGAFK
jgi:hypothetical protein